MHNLLKYVQLYTGCDDKVLKRLEPLLEKYITKPKVIVLEKKVEVVKYHKFNVEPVTSITEFFKDYNRNTKHSLEDIKKRCRSVEVRQKRNHFIRSAISHGYNLTTIAKFLNMHHTTILNVIKNSKI
jgi:hypothetical protein